MAQLGTINPGTGQEKLLELAAGANARLHLPAPHPHPGSCFSTQPVPGCCSMGRVPVVRQDQESVPGGLRGGRDSR